MNDGLNIDTALDTVSGKRLRHSGSMAWKIHLRGLLVFAAVWNIHGKNDLTLTKANMRQIEINIQEHT